MDKEPKKTGGHPKPQPTEDVEANFRALENQVERLEQGNAELRQQLIERYTTLLRLIDHTHPLHKPIIGRLKVLREQEKIGTSETRVEALKEINLQALLEAAKVVEVVDGVEIERCVIWFSALPDKLKVPFAKRLADIATKPTETVRITSFRAINFEMSRLTRVMQQGLEQVDVSAAMDSVEVDYSGYDKDATTFDAATKHSVKRGSRIDFDVPISRDGVPYAYEAKSFSRKRYGFDASARNQLLKYQTAVEQGKISGATVEVRGRIDPEFINWLMGTAIDDRGFVPDVEVVYTIELPSGKEYRFILKRAERGHGLRFQNEEKYADEELLLIRGLQHSLIDKSVRGLLADTHIDAVASHQVFEQAYGERNLTMPEGGVNAETLVETIGDLMAFSDEPENRMAVIREIIDNIQDPNTVDAIWTNLLGEIPAKEQALPVGKKVERLRKLLRDVPLTNEKVFQFCSAVVGYDITQQPERGLKELWDFVMAEPARISSAKVFGIYEQLRTQAILEKVHQSEQRAKINSDNKASSTSEQANPVYVERLILEYQEFLAQNPNVAAIKRQYIIPLEQISVAVEQSMGIIEKIRAYELARQADSNEEIRRAERAALGYDGRPEGVALDIEHVAIDTLFSMNAEGLPRADVESQLKGATLTFFDELPDGRLKIKWRTPEDFSVAAEADLQLKKAYEGLSKKYKDQVDIWIKSAAFVRSYEWPERFMQAENLPAFLEGQDRRYQEIHVYDPVTGKTERHTNTNEEAIQKTENLLIKENIERAKQRIAETGRAGQYKRPIARVETVIAHLESQRDQALGAAQVGAKQIVADLGRRQGELNQLRKILTQQLREPGVDNEGVTAQLQALEQELVSVSDQRTSAFDQVRSISVEYLVQIQAKQRELEGIYRQIFPKAEWRSFAKEISHRQDENLMKLIYAVTAEGEAIVQEEVLRAQVTGRAAHSELNSGRNTYGAGELAFEKRGDRWVLIEINNGSGHYRPDADNTLHYVKKLIEKKGIDVSSAQCVDCILRGRPLREASAF